MKLFSTIFLSCGMLAAISSFTFAGGYDDMHPIVADHNVDLDIMIPRRPATALKSIDASRRKAPAKTPLAGGFTLCGALINSSDFSSVSHPYGIYSIVSDNEGALSVNPLISSSAFDATAGSCLTSEGYLITGAKKYMGYYIVDHYLYDPSDWTLISKTAGDMESMARSLTCVGSTLYGSFINIDGTFSFSSLDVKKFSKKKIVARMEHPYSALAADNDGTIYAIDFEGNLLTVDKKTGKETLVATLGLPSEYATAAVMNPAADRIYYVQARSDASELFSINPESGETLSLGIFSRGEQWQGLFLPIPEAPDAAPAIPGNLTADFGAPSLAGSVSFTAPMTLFDGSEPTADFSWVLRLDGEEYENGTVSPGDKVEVGVTAAAPGLHSFEAVCTNDAGEGPAASLELYIGPDSPAEVSDIKLDIDRTTGHAILSWTAPSAGEHGEWFDPTLLSYEIVRYPDGTTVAGSLQSTSWEEDIELPESETVAYYSVTPLHAGLKGKTSISPKVSLGEISLPYKHSFKGSDALDGFNVVDVNNDGVTWTADPDGSAYVSYAPRTMNDWIISAPIYMRKGMVYPVTLDAWSQTARHDERIAFWIGKGNTPDMMDTRLLSTILDGHPEPFWIQVTVPEDGYYNFGIQGCSLPSQYFLRLDSIEIGEPYLQSSPDMPVFSFMSPSPDGELLMSGSIFLPSRAADGSRQLSIDSVMLKCGDRVIKKIENPTPGASITFIDRPDAAGRYEYTAVTSAYNGESLTASCPVFVGVNIPMNPVPGVVSGEDGLSLRWSAPDKGADGLELNTRVITYHIFDSQFREIGTTAETAFSVDTPENSPSVTTWFVKAETSAGVNPDWKGMASFYNHGCHEDGLFASAAGAHDPLSCLLHNGENTGRQGWHKVTLSDGTTVWESVPGEELPGVARECVAILPVVAVAEDSPVACFRFPEGEPEEGVVSVYAVIADEWNRLDRISYDAARPGEMIYDLSPYAGQMVNVALIASGRVVVDSFAIEYLQPLSVRISTGVRESVHTPGTAKLSAKIVNHGKNQAGPFEAALYSAPSGSDEYVKASSFMIESLAGGGSAIDVELPLVLPQFGKESSYRYYFALKGVEGNDRRYETTAPALLAVADLSYPRPVDLEAAVDSSLTSVELHWQTPLGLDANDTFIRDEDGRQYPLTGYKIYADSHLIGESVDRSFVESLDPEAYVEPIERRYNVVAVYGDWESFPGDDCMVVLSEADMTSASPDGHLTISRTAGNVNVSGVFGILNVYSADGKLLESLTPADGSVSLHLLPGIYVIADSRSSLRIYNLPL